MTVCSNQQIVRAYLPRFSPCPARTANDISTPKKAETAPRQVQARAGSEFALSGSEQNPDQGGEVQ